MKWSDREAGDGERSSCTIRALSRVTAVVVLVVRSQVETLSPETTTMELSVIPRQSTPSTMSISNCELPDWRSRTVTLIPL